MYDCYHKPPAGVRAEDKILHKVVKTSDQLKYQPQSGKIGRVLMYFNDIILVPGVDWSRLQSDQSPDWNQLLGHHEASLSPDQTQQPEQPLLPQV